MLSAFSSWDEVKEHVRHDSNAHELVTWTRLIDEYGIPALDNAITVASLWSKEGAVVSTAHKAKGLEWDTVRIADDFAVLLARAALSGNKEHLAEEKRLAYVAVTRARRRIDPGPLAHFADFMNR
jgi:superfamily I DNA/RNA helicase